MPRTTEIIIHRIQIKKSGKQFGNLWIGKLGIEWQGRYSTAPKKMTWKEFDQRMKERAETT
jgi:hypothetical protein